MDELDAGTLALSNNSSDASGSSASLIKRKRITANKKNMALWPLDACILARNGRRDATSRL